MEFLFLKGTWTKTKKDYFMNIRLMKKNLGTPNSSNFRLANVIVC